MKRRLSMSVSLILLLGLGMMYSLAVATADDCDKQALVPLGTDTQGTATLCVNTKGVRANIKARELTPGNVYTFWLGYVDRPDLCAMGPGACEGADFGFGNPSANPLGVLGRMDSVVADKNGKEKFVGRVRGLRLSGGSQVIFVIRWHGQAVTNDNRRRARQLLTPQDPPAGAPSLGVVGEPEGSDNAVAIFNIP